MSGSTLIIGGERSSGKTTLLNYLVSGSVASPFPRGVRGRLSRSNNANFLGLISNTSQESRAPVLRISTEGQRKKEVDIEIRANSEHHTDLLLMAAHDLNQRILHAQPTDEPTCLSMSFNFINNESINSIAEIGPDCLRSFLESDSLLQPMVSSKIGMPDVYIHLTSAIKPLAFVERQAILKFITKRIPVILFVNKCDLVDDEESLGEIDDLISVFSSMDCERWLPNYLCSFINDSRLDSGIITIEEVARLILSLLPGKSVSANSLGSSIPTQTRKLVNIDPSDLEQPVSFQQDLLGRESDEISMWPPQEHKHILDRLNRCRQNPLALLEEMRTIDSKILSKLRTLYWYQMSPEVRRVLMLSRHQAQ